MDTAQQEAPVVRSKEPTWWGDYVMWWLIGPVGTVIVVVAFLFAFGPVSDFVEKHTPQTTAASPADFNQKFFAWSYVNLEHEQDMAYSCYHAGGIMKDDGNCHDSESIRLPSPSARYPYPYLRPSR